MDKCSNMGTDFSNISLLYIWWISSGVEGRVSEKSISKVLLALKGAVELIIRSDFSGGHCEIMVYLIWVV